MSDSAVLSPRGGNITGEMKWYGGSIAANTSIFGNVDASTGYKFVDGAYVSVLGSFSLANSNLKVINNYYNNNVIVLTDIFLIIAHKWGFYEIGEYVITRNWREHLH